MSVRIAILDLYDGETNEGMRALRALIAAYDQALGGDAVTLSEYDVRARGEVPGLDHDVYVSSGGPGSPFDGEGRQWEADYFAWVDALWNHNQRLPAGSSERKHALFICHSFQMVCRYFALGRVVKRQTESFGIFATHQTVAGKRDPLFVGLPDPFYAADFRRWQVVDASDVMLEQLGGAVLALESDRPASHPDEALMAIRISPEFVGVQFHPEADPVGMLLHFSKPERKDNIVEQYGEGKYRQILARMGDDMFLKRTHDVVVPNFLAHAVGSIGVADVAAGGR